LQLQFDPLNKPASLVLVQETWKSILQFPIKCDDDNIFQFDRDSKEMMEGALEGWDAAGVTTIDWRLLDNSKVTCTKVQLQAYYDELIVKRSVRGFAVDAEYLAFKTGSPTHRDLENWKNQHYPSSN